MNIETLKYEIIEWITKTNDDSLLHTLKTIKDSQVSSTDWYEQLDREELDSLNRGIADHENGNVLTSKEFWSEHGSKI